VSLKSFVSGLISPGDPTSITEYRLPGRGRMPNGWSRDYVVIETLGRTGKEVFHATRDAKGDVYFRVGRPHRMVARNTTWESKDKVHLTRSGLLRDDSLATAARLRVNHAGRMDWPRTRLSTRALQRELDAGAARVVRTNVVANDTWKAHGFSDQVTAVFDRQAADLRSLKLSAQRLQYSAREMAKEAAKGIRGLPRPVTDARIKWAKAAAYAESLAKAAAEANEQAIQLAAKASEASAKAAAAAAEAEAKAAAAAAEKASKEAARAAEAAAKQAAKTAEGLAKTAAKAAEAAVRTAAGAAEATAKASLALAEATAKGVAYAAAATAAAVASAFDR
jgi:hypothetical protein